MHAWFWSQHCFPWGNLRGNESLLAQFYCLQFFLRLLNSVKGLGCFWFIRTGFGVCPRNAWVRMSVNLQVFYRVPVEIGGGNVFFRESFWALHKLRQWMTRTWKATSLFSASTGYPSDFTPSALSNIEKEFYCRQFSIHFDKHYRDN